MMALDETRLEYAPDSRRIRAVQHLWKPFEGQADESPEHLAARYAAAIADLYDFDLNGSIERTVEPPAPGSYLEWAPIESYAAGGDATLPLARRMASLVAFTDRGVRLEFPGSGFRVVMRQHRHGAPVYCVTSSSSTIPPTTLKPEGLVFPDEWMRAPLQDRAIALVRGLGYAVVDDRLTTRIVMLARLENPRSFVPCLEVDCLIYSDPETRHDVGGYRFVWEGPGEDLRFRSIQPLVANCFGSVFAGDPASRFGDIDLTPELSCSELNPSREDVTLTGLLPALPGMEPVLIGDLIQISGTGGTQNLLGINPPAAVGGAFRFDARTNAFAATNAYHHCNCAFRMARDFNCTAGTYFHATQFPLLVTHRGPMVISPPSPNPVTAIAPYIDAQVFTANAQAFQDLGGPGLANRVRELRFALASTDDARHSPLGAATDRRIMWHEFGHALLVAGTAALELPFAHSAGDALSAILSDPGSELARPHWNTNGVTMRGVTFPFVADALRRHDRRVAHGWAWNGTLNDPAAYPPPLDPNGYTAEEILSSTLFRLYCAIGGDATQAGGEPDRQRRRRAAEYVAYLIIWAIGFLGPADVSPSTPGILATTLMETDALVGLFDYQSDPGMPVPPRRGGALVKVIRWAFEQQGLYWPVGAVRPWNQPGAPEPADIFVDDGRQGRYDFTDAWQSLPTAVRVVLAAAPGTAGPVAGVANQVLVRVGNRGTAPVNGITVRVWVTSTNPDVWNTTGDWQPLLIGGQAISAPTGAPLLPGGEIEIGPFAWQPVAGLRQALIIATDAPGDASLLDLAGDLACTQGPTAVADLIPFDNNLGYRVWTLP